MNTRFFPESVQLFDTFRKNDFSIQSIGKTYCLKVAPGILNDIDATRILIFNFTNSIILNSFIVGLEEKL